ncbi:hypothetical protein [Pseudoduganella buxea]|uniref:Uncharacterized protein n=1 Tax=Pseudoduganella buxea TaxID=1949069 RepID=A0A6I3T302_9BURK|nr:hypothetical protein [Pseudoduganella buxea]MTV55794.1 hypothetical protein [Pseudoduganella buxea]GGB99359.1 hypothetical protein GCM10011572_21620 [Pseudoduganella buxea]
MKKQLFAGAAGATVTVAELLDLARREVDPRAPESLMTLAAPLHALARDRTLLQKCINFGLTHWREGSLHFYSSQSCHIASIDNFVIRINLWPLLPLDPRRRTILADVLSYFDYHDHNFSFITANYFGPGYETEIYSYSRDRLIGYPGEKVELTYEGRHGLNDNTVMLYEQFRDIHMQLPPPALSASINLMMNCPHSGLTHQFYFDIENSCIRDYVGAVSDKRVNALGFARHLHDAETPALLQRIAESHPCSRTRVEAGRILVSIAGEAALSASSRARMLADPLARALWRRAEQGS